MPKFPSQRSESLQMDSKTHRCVVHRELLLCVNELFAAITLILVSSTKMVDLNEFGESLLYRSNVHDIQTEVERSVEGIRGMAT